ncbi:glycosyltransferase family 2 protein [Candidatus Omnitrophota bacterium]
MNKDLVVCPVYNEESTLEKFYGLLREHYAGDALFVDDGSTDRSRDLLSGVEGRETFVIRHDQRSGYGAALMSGFKFSLEKGYSRIITLDADLQHDPAKIHEFLEDLLGADLVLGSRYIRFDKYLDVPMERLIINRYVSKMINMIFSVQFTDPFCGYRGYRDTFLREINIEDKGYRMALEVLLEAIRVGASIREIPIEAVYLDYMRKFLDGLDDPHKRLQYYIEIIERKRSEIEDEKKIFSDQSPS